MITNIETKTTGTAGIPAGAIGEAQSTTALPAAIENIIIPQSIINFCDRIYPPYLGSAYDTQRAHLIAKRLAIEGFSPLPCDIATFIASPAFAQLKLQTEKISPKSATSATNVDSQSVANINDPLQSATNALQRATDPLQAETQPQQSAPDTQQPATNSLQLIAEEFDDLLDKRSPLDQLTSDQQDAIYLLLKKQPLRQVADWLAEPLPLGLALKIHFTSLSRFARRHADRKRTRACREKLKLAEQIVSQSANKDEGYSNAAIRLLHERVVQATADDNTNPDELKTLVATLTALRMQTLAERKFAAG